MVAFSKLLPPAAFRRREPDGAPRMRLASGPTDSFGGDDEDQGPLGRIDRRIFPRQPVSLRVGGRRLDHTVEARREPCLHLSIRDVSVGGLAATSQSPLKVGERIAVFFPPEGISRGWDAYGHVLRVKPGRQGYDVAVAFDRLPAA